MIALAVDGEFWKQLIRASIPVYIEVWFGSDGLDFKAYLCVKVTGSTQEGGITCSVSNIELF